jgi:cellulose synthase/poly-beta-1,6-N-acetylglucosamine synthase-like glycosyltransferase
MSRTVSVGVCAHNEARRIPALLESLTSQEVPDGFALLEVLVVASGCTDKTVDVIQDWTNLEPRIALIQEPERRGKSSAINVILQRYRGDLLVLVNADARLAPGSLRALLQVFRENTDNEIACGFPIPEATGSPVVSVVEDGWWRLHNRTLTSLAKLGNGNHCCDEFMAMKRGFSTSIPTDIICDGSYFGALGAIRGQTVQIRESAVVFVEVPATLFGVLRQRRRNLRGHWQVARLLGQRPYTLESLIRTRPALAARILVLELVHRPLPTLAFLIIAGPLELLAHSLARLDGTVHRGYQPVWPMVE